MYHMTYIIWLYASRSTRSRGQSLHMRDMTHAIYHHMTHISDMTQQGAAASHYIWETWLMPYIITWLMRYTYKRHDSTRSRGQYLHNFTCTHSFCGCGCVCVSVWHANTHTCVCVGVCVFVVWSVYVICNMKGMYVCMCKYVYVCVHAYHMYIYVCMYIYVYTHMHTYMNIFIRIYI